jgi:hypothetical protein
MTPAYGKRLARGTTGNKVNGAQRRVVEATDICLTDRPVGKVTNATLLVRKERVARLRVAFNYHGVSEARLRDTERQAATPSKKLNATHRDGLPRAKRSRSSTTADGA